MNTKKITTTRIDNSAMRNIIANIDEIDYNETVISLAISLFGIDRKFYDNSSFNEFSDYVTNLGKTMMDKHQVNAIKILLKYKKNSINSFYISNSVPLNMQQNYVVDRYSNNIEITNLSKPLNCNDDEMKKQKMIEMFNNSVNDGSFI